MLSRERNDALTRVAKGMPAGELLSRQAMASADASTQKESLS